MPKDYQSQTLKALLSPPDQNQLDVKSQQEQRQALKHQVLESHFTIKAFEVRFDNTTAFVPSTATKTLLITAAFDSHFQVCIFMLPGFELSFKETLR